MKGKYRIFLCSAIAMILTGTGSTVHARDASCLVSSYGIPTFKRICDFRPDGTNGSFSLSASKGNGEFLEDVRILSVTVLSPGNAEVRGLTANGINSRWGSARRSKKDDVCWIGDSFAICAW